MPEPESTYAVCPECAHVEPRPAHAIECWDECENCGELSPLAYDDPDDAEIASEGVAELHDAR